MVQTKTSRHGYLLLLMISNPIAESLRVRVNHSSRVVAGDNSHKSLIPLVFGTWLVLYDFHVYVQDISVIHMEVGGFLKWGYPQIIRT
jgi:HAMP domain-containing protein